MKIRKSLWKKGKTYKRPYTGSKRFDPVEITEVVDIVVTKELTTYAK